MPPRGSGAPRDPSHYRSPPRKSHQPAAPGTGEADPKLCPGILGGLITNRRRPPSTPKKPSDFYPLCFSNIQLYEPRDVSGTLHQQAIITTPFLCSFSPKQRFQAAVSTPAWKRFAYKEGERYFSRQLQLQRRGCESKGKSRRSSRSCSMLLGCWGWSGPQASSVLGIGSHLALQMGFNIPIFPGARGKLPGLTHPTAHCSSRHLVALMLSQFNSLSCWLRESGKSRGVMETHRMPLGWRTQHACPAKQLRGLGAQNANCGPKRCTVPAVPAAPAPLAAPRAVPAFRTGRAGRAEGIRKPQREDQSGLRWEDARAVHPEQVWLRLPWN